MPAIELSALAAAVGGRLEGPESTEIVDVVHDSRRVKPGCLFVAIRGAAHDGHDHVPGAVAAEAAAVCVERSVAVDVPQLVVSDTRAALPILAAETWGHPSRQVPVVGITGTNGKTTVTYMLEAIFTADRLRTGVIGTVGARLTGGRGDTRRLHLDRTTPESSDLQRLLAEMVDDGVEVVAMEVSSHALELGRVTATNFRVGAFTNLSQDHLDFHGDMEAYFAAKARLFDGVGSAVVCTDDSWGRRLADELTDRRDLELITVGRGAEVSATDSETNRSGSVFTVSYGGEQLRVTLPLPGEFNIANALVAIGCARVLGASPSAVVDGLAALAPIPGRMERLEHEGSFSVYVDYAHTPDGIDVVISAARVVTDGRVIVVIGAGGDRDRAKRPLMGTAAGAADVVIVTSDNPRTEDPAAIIADVAAGIPDATELVVEPDRRTAIESAIGFARDDDVVLILGKGHEQGQDLGTTVIPFDDTTVARRALQEARA